VRGATAAYAALGLALLLSAAAAAQRNDPTPVPEEDIKSVFLYNFSRFVRWPDGALGPPSTPLRIGVLNTAAFEKSFQRLAGKTAQGRPVVFVHCRRIEELRQCAIVYLNARDDLLIKRALTALSGHPVLTVGDGPDFLRWGGMLSFTHRENRIRLAANPAAAADAGIRLGARLLQVCDVRGPPDAQRNGTAAEGGSS